MRQPRRPPFTLHDPSHVIQTTSMPTYPESQDMRLIHVTFDNRCRASMADCLTPVSTSNNNKQMESKLSDWLNHMLDEVFHHQTPFSINTSTAFLSVHMSQCKHSILSVVIQINPLDNR